MDFAVSCPLVRYGRLLFGFCPSTRTFVPCFLRTPPRGDSPCIFTRPSPPSGRPEDFHLLVTEHAQHTTKPLCGGRCRVGKAEVRGSCPQINCGSQGGHPCDPSTQNHAGRTPASSLLGGYHTTIHPVRRKIRTTLPLLSGPPGSAAHSGVPGPTLQCRSYRPGQ